MARRRSAIEVDTEEDVRAELGALCMLMFASTSDRAPHFNDLLLPVRQCARGAMMAAPRNADDTRSLRRARDRCWTLLDEAAETIDAEDWFLNEGDSTRAWAERHVGRLLAARSALSA